MSAARQINCLCGRVGFFDVPRPKPGDAKFVDKLQKNIDDVRKKDSPNHVYLLGQGFNTRNVEEAATLALERDYAKLARFKLEDEETIGHTSIPETFMPYAPEIIQDFNDAMANQKKYFPDNNKLRKRIERAMSDRIEKHFFVFIDKRNRKRNVASFMINGLVFLKVDAAPGEDEQEADIFLVNFTYQYIMNVEVKTWLGPWENANPNSPNKSPLEKAGDQLDSIRRHFMDNFKHKLKGDWKYGSIIFCQEMASFIAACKCGRFVMTPNDVEEKFDAIEAEAMEGRTIDQKYPEDFVNLAKDALYRAPKFILPTTGRIHGVIKEAIDKASSPENIEIVAFPTPAQREILAKKHDDNYKIVFFGPWGSGKTILMSDFAIHLAKKKEQVLYLVFQARIDEKSELEPLLVLHLQEKFCKYKDYITVKSVPVIDGVPIGLSDTVKGHKHLIADEVFADLDVLKPVTKNEVIQVFNSMETVAITPSNQYHGRDVSVRKDLKKMIKDWLGNGFEWVETNISIRVPANGAKDLQDEYQNKLRRGKGTFNEILMSKAKVPENLVEAPPIKEIGFDDDLSVEQVIKKAFEDVPANKYALIIINDSLEGEDTFHHTQAVKTADCQNCKEMIMYLTVDKAMQKAGRKAPLFYCNGYQSRIMLIMRWLAGEQDCDMVVSFSVMKGYEAPFIIEMSKIIEMRSRSCGQIILTSPDWLDSMKQVSSEILADDKHICSLIMDRDGRQLDLNPLIKSDMRALKQFDFTVEDIIPKPEIYIGKNGKERPIALGFGNSGSSSGAKDAIHVIQQLYSFTVSNICLKDGDLMKKCIEIGQAIIKAKSVAKLNDLLVHLPHLPTSFDVSAVGIGVVSHTSSHAEVVSNLKNKKQKLKLFPELQSQIDGNNQPQMEFYLIIQETAEMYGKCHEYFAPLMTLADFLKSGAKDELELQKSLSTKDHKSVLLLGKVGVGKSLLGNILLQDFTRLSISKDGQLKLCTKKINKYTNDARKISVIDTQGLLTNDVLAKLKQQPGQSDPVLSGHIKDVFKKLSGVSFDVIMVVIDLKSMLDDSLEKQMIGSLLHHLNQEGFLKHVMLVVNKGLTNDNIPLDDTACKALAQYLFPNLLMEADQSKKVLLMPRIISHRLSNSMIARHFDNHMTEMARTVFHGIHAEFDGVSNATFILKSPFQGGYILVSGGYYNGEGSDKVELINSSGHLKTLVDLPHEATQAVSGMLMGQPVIYGAYFRNDLWRDHSECYKLSSNGLSWIKFAKMKSARSGAAAIVLSNKIWICGGFYREHGWIDDIFRDERTKLKSSELITINGNVEEGPNLPEPLNGHTLIQIKDEIFLVGGQNDGNEDTRSTRIFNSQLEHVKDGPKLNIGRSYHGCCSVQSSNHEGRSIIVVAGGYPETRSVEVLDFSQPGASWQKMKNLPVSMPSKPALHPLPNEEGVLIIHKDVCYKMIIKNGDYLYEKLDFALQHPRYYFTSVMVPNEFAEKLLEKN